TQQGLTKLDARAWLEALDQLDAGLGEEHDGAAEMKHAELVALGQKWAGVEIDDRLPIGVRSDLLERAAHVTDAECGDHDQRDDAKVSLEHEHEALVDGEQPGLASDGRVVDREQSPGD